MYVVFKGGVEVVRSCAMVRLLDGMLLEMSSFRFYAVSERDRMALCLAEGGVSSLRSCAWLQLYSRGRGRARSTPCRFSTVEYT